MSSTSTAHGATAAPEHGAGHGHGAHSDPAEHLAHHFDTAQQQFDSGKLGIWAFLVTEVLFFSGLFCAYAIYRSHHPEVFVYASQFLDVRLGAVNTAVLILSSLTAAWAVRAAQLGQKKLLVWNLVITILCACTFMVVKYFEYSHKIHIGLRPGGNFIWTPEGEKAFEESGVLAVPAADPTAPVVAADGSVTPPAIPRHVKIFFSVYYGMTGLHGFHVLCGIVVFIWLLKRALRGEFGPKYFGPIDFAALYWHIVDVIWIYLFPLLYLIH